MAVNGVEKETMRLPRRASNASERTCRHEDGRPIPVAVVGIGCRYPGGATDPEKLWRICAEQRDLWQPIPKDRFNTDVFYHPNPARNGTVSARGAHFLEEDPSYFDASFFNVTSVEAAAMDPQQRILLECSYEALENAGISLEKVAGSDTAVFVGSSCADYTVLLQRDPEKTARYQATGSGQTMLANRISYFYDLKGPSATIDTACSASLVALHQACNAIRTGESTQAIVGGSNLILTPEPMVALDMLGFLSPDGRCHSFDDRANGFGRGEGAACIVLKRLDEALKDGNPIRAVIRNTGSNQDGKTAGITLPNGESQVALMQHLYKAADLDPARTSYVEAHGTGTQAGDPIEARALARVFSPGRSPDQPLIIGSIKSNIGHLEGGSGIAAVVKTVLMLEKGLILPNFDFRRANPGVSKRDLKIEVPTKVREWPSGDVRRASVNNFGFGGSNAHVIIEGTESYLSSHGLGNLQADAPSSRNQDVELSNGHVSEEDRFRNYDPLIEGLAPNGYTVDKNSIQNPKASKEARLSKYVTMGRKTHRARLYVLSASNELSGKQQAQLLSEYLKNKNIDSCELSMDDLAFTLGERRSSFTWRAGIPASTLPDLTDTLSSERLTFSKASVAPKLGYVFTGQGAQWHAMGRELIAVFPKYRESLILSDNYLKSLGASWSLIDELSKDRVTSKINQEYLSQPLCTAIQVALVDLLGTWNVRPARVTGHSSGEIAAAYSCGALSRQGALAVAYYRGIAAAAARSNHTLPEGAMIAVGLSEVETKSMIADLTQGQVGIACVNSPKSVTVSGDKPAVSELHTMLQRKGIFARLLSVKVAYHSHHMATVADQYLSMLRGIQTCKADDVEFYSSVSGKREGSSRLDAAYWVANMVSPVQFSDSVTSLCLNTHQDGQLKKGSSAAVDCMIEIGPHSALKSPLNQILKSISNPSSPVVAYVPTLARNSDPVETMMDMAASLFRLGVAISLGAINHPEGHQMANVLIDLPTYPWNHTTQFWAESQSSLRYRTGFHSRSDFLGVPIKDCNPLEPCWRNYIRLSEIPWLGDHRIQSNVIYPAAGFLAMAIEAALQRAKARNVEVVGYDFREVSIKRALVIPDDVDEVETQFLLRPYSESVQMGSDIWDEFFVSSSVDGATWTEHCHGLISVRKQSSFTEVDGGRQDAEDGAENERMILDCESNCTNKLEIKEVYRGLKELGLDYGPTFCNMRSARSSHDKSIAQVFVPDTKAVMPANFEYPYVVHPTLLDSCLHAIFLIDNGYENPNQGTPVPTFIREAFVAHNVVKEAGREMTACALTSRKNLVGSPSKGYDRTISSVSVFDKPQRGIKPVIRVSGLKLSSIGTTNTAAKSQNDERHLYYQTTWQPDPAFLSADQSFELTSHARHALLDQGQDEKLQQAAFYYAERALQFISPKDVSSLAPHHQKLYRCLSEDCKTVKGRHLGETHTDTWLGANPNEREKACAQFKGTSFEILCSIGENLPHVLRQEVDPLSLMLENNRLENYYRADQRLSQCYQHAVHYISLLANKNPFLKILEIGAGTGGATLPILLALGGANGKEPGFSIYDYTDVSPAFFEKAMEKTKTWSHLMDFRKLDIESDPLRQGFEEGSYDLVIASNVLHATRRMEQTMARVRSLLKPAGSLVLVETTAKNIVASLIFGTLPDWWAGEEDSRQDGPLLTEQQWDSVLRTTRFDGLQANLWDMPDPKNHYMSTMASLASSEKASQYPNVTIVTDNELSDPSVENLASLLQEVGINPTVSNLDNCEVRDQLCIVLCDLEKSILRNPTAAQYSAIKRLVLESSGVLWLTRGALLESSAPDANLATGLLRTIREEKGDTTLVSLDLDAQTPLSSPIAAKRIISVFKTNFLNNDQPSVGLDTEYLERDGIIMTPRVVEDKALTSFVASKRGPATLVDQPFRQPNRPLKAQIKTSGLLDSLHFVDDDQMYGPLSDDFVHIDIKASGINFRDVMSALGQIDPYPLGCEASGIVSAVGSRVERIRPGDHVTVTSNGGCFCSSMRVPARAVELIPLKMPFEIAASLPIVYLTAYYAVIKIARLERGQTVLVHAASGGLGQAILNLCQYVGAEIFATVGTLEKKSLLMAEYNIAEDHIFSSRDGTFAKGVMRMTGGKGVDAVMNSLSGDLLRLSWDCIAEFGRFVELGKRDFTVNSRLEMRNFEKNVSFTGLDLPLDSKREEKHEIWGELMRMYQEGRIRAPDPITVFPVSQLEKALRTMQSGKHIGKLVLVPQPGEMVKALPQDDSHRPLKADATYFLVGGLGGIGRALALWMTRHGARNFIFLSPSGLEKTKAEETVSLLRDAGARVAVFKGDVSNHVDVERALTQYAEDMPPVRGVIQAAMVPTADLFENMTLSDYSAAMRPKVDGTWNLHHAFSSQPLDFFIMLSSVVGLIGNPSQAAYVAASLFLDAFADYRNNQGLPAVTLDLGRIVGVGFVAENEAARRGTEKLWSRDIDEPELMAMIESAIREPFRKGRPGSSVSGLKPWKPEAGAVYNSPLFSRYRRAAMETSRTSEKMGGMSGSVRELLRKAKTLEEAAQIACEGIMGKMATLLMIPLEDISQDKSMSEYGMDSLVAVEMRNWLVKELDSTLPLLELLSPSHSVFQLAEKIVGGSKFVDVGGGEM